MLSPWSCFDISSSSLMVLFSSLRRFCWSDFCWTLSSSILVSDSFTYSWNWSSKSENFCFKSWFSLVNSFWAMPKSSFSLFRLSMLVSIYFIFSISLSRMLELFFLFSCNSFMTSSTIEIVLIWLLTISPNPNKDTIGFTGYFFYFLPFIGLLFILFLIPTGMW